MHRKTHECYCTVLQCFGCYNNTLEIIQTGYNVVQSLGYIFIETGNIHFYVIPLYKARWINLSEGVPYGPDNEPVLHY